MLILARSLVLELRRCREGLCDDAHKDLNGFGAGFEVERHARHYWRGGLLEKRQSQLHGSSPLWSQGWAAGSGRGSGERLGWSVRGGNRQAWRGYGADHSQSPRQAPRPALPPNRSTPPGSVSGCRRGARPTAMLRHGGARRPALAERGPRRDAARGGLSPDVESRGDG